MRAAADGLVPRLRRTKSFVRIVNYAPKLLRAPNGPVGAVFPVRICRPPPSALRIHSGHRNDSSQPLRASFGADGRTRTGVRNRTARSGQIIGADGVGGANAATVSAGATPEKCRVTTDSGIATTVSVTWLETTWRVSRTLVAKATQTFGTVERLLNVGTDVARASETLREFRHRLLSVPRV